MGLNFNRPDAPTQTAPAAQTELEQVMHAITEGTNAQADMTPKEECYYAEIDGVPTVLE